MIGIYFSGTGNTEYCIKKFVSVYAPGSPIISIEDNSILEAINQHQEIIFAYPIYYSNLPKIVRDFIVKNHTVWYGKRIFFIANVKTLKRSIPQNRKLIKDATNKLIKAAHQLKENRPPQEGINVFYHIAGLLGQRLWFYNKTRSYTDQLHIDPNACICCGKCAGLCPMKNISIIDNRVQAHDQCTMCYRCINQCPQRAITLIGKEVIEQHRVEDFL